MSRRWQLIYRSVLINAPTFNQKFNIASNYFRLFELFTWLVEISEDAPEPYEDAKVVWTVKFEPSQDESSANEPHKSEGRKSTTKLDIQKDDIQAVVPISKVRDGS